MGEILEQDRTAFIDMERQKKNLPAVVILSSEKEPNLELPEIMARQQMLKDLNYTLGEM